MALSASDPEPIEPESKAVDDEVRYKRSLIFLIASSVALLIAIFMLGFSFFLSFSGIPFFIPFGILFALVAGIFGASLFVFLHRLVHRRRMEQGEDYLNEERLKDFGSRGLILAIANVILGVIAYVGAVLLFVAALLVLIALIVLLFDEIFLLFLGLVLAASIIGVISLLAILLYIATFIAAVGYLILSFKDSKQAQLALFVLLTEPIIFAILTAILVAFFLSAFA